MTEAEYLCDQIAVLNKGKIVAVDTPEQLKNTFGKQKTIKIRLNGIHKDLAEVIDGISDCTISHGIGTEIMIHSTKSELVLSQILQLLVANKIAVEDLSAMPTSLEEIFLRMVDSNAPDS